ncbi:uncharacterized protein LOC108739294 [Agrilus planipennis]|uniref:Uncharacterized protein LOC108739294 n=1 Tax=Agrilus planipennis TaxID=224129 RepID=A0A1W4X729_AGRPL|nr:uncharacterized protein LOC108739294 [Agrilus planipennis]
MNFIVPLSKFIGKRNLSCSFYLRRYNNSLQFLTDHSHIFSSPIKQIKDVQNGIFNKTAIAKLKSIETRGRGLLFLPSKNYTDHPKKTPELIYIPRLLRWMKVKMKLRLLKKWDPNFSEGAFIYGSLMALCRITEIIHEDDPKQLVGLLTEPARLKLTEDMTHKLSKLQKDIIQLKMSDIKILVPVSVNFRQVGNEKYCDIAVRSLALKWLEKKGQLVLVALEAEFSRNYTEGAKAEWTISNFNILECALLNEISSTAR